MGKMIEPENVRAEKMTWEIIVLRHMDRLSMLASESPYINENGTMTDFRISRMWSSIMLLDCWLSDFSDPNYEKIANEYRKLILPHPNTPSENFLRLLFNWHKAQIPLLRKAGVQPIPIQWEPLDMTVGREEEKYPGKDEGPIEEE